MYAIRSYYAPFQPGLPAALAKSGELFERIAREDILLHHPYQSFGPVIDFIRTTATRNNFV